MHVRASRARLAKLLKMEMLSGVARQLEDLEVADMRLVSGWPGSPTNLEVGLCQAGQIVVRVQSLQNSHDRIKKRFQSKEIFTIATVIVPHEKGGLTNH